MINRANYLDAKDYTDYLHHVRQNDPESVLRYWAYLRHFLDWAGEKTFAQMVNVEPSFPTYLLSSRIDGKDKQLSPSTMKKTCEAARNFIEYAKNYHAERYKSVPAGWIETIRPSRAHGTQSELIEHEFYTPEEMFQIAAAPVISLRQERDRAAACFLFLSGMRVTAFVSLPISCVDLSAGKVEQFPSRGVRTKNHKAARTSLLIIPELTSVIRAWDARVRAELPIDSPWYPLINRSFEKFMVSEQKSRDRRLLLSHGLEAICKLASVEYHSPHKFRHGNAVYSLKRVKDMAGLKAVSMNLMHSTIGITDGIYGRLTSDDMHDVISALGGGEKRPAPESIPAGAPGEVADLARMLLENPELAKVVSALLAVTKGK